MKNVVAISFLWFGLLCALVPQPSWANCSSDCQDKQCGPDGCGGSCGTCSQGGCVQGMCVTDCGLVPAVGCCDAGNLVRCIGGKVVTGSCEQYPICGWSDFWRAYACYTGGEEDPAGQHPLQCDIDCDSNCVGRECGPNGCEGVCGECALNAVCVDGHCCTPDCSGRVCGPDGCGGLCGECAPQEHCLDGACCTKDCDGKECGPDGCGGSCGTCQWGVCIEGVCRTDCMGVSVWGCCYEGHVLRCSGTQLYMLDCSKNPSCGWRPWSDGYFCGSDGAEDPAGIHPKECTFQCVPDCEGKQCGSDGCGGTCGSCPEGQICRLGTCCSPQCEGRECGPDGCGGNCGYCSPYEQVVCKDGQCVPAYGCVEGGVGCPGCSCEECVCELYPECCALHWSATCVKACKNQCGGCHPCEPTCVGKQCGTDGCWGSCGSCPEGYVCSSSYSCCEQQCQGKECGPDGCGGICGLCPSGSVCRGNGVCEPTHGCEATFAPGCGGCKCEPCVCANDDFCCDEEWDWLCVESCHFDCGGCGPSTCVPSCGGKECGPDGCGGSCGQCSDGEVCHQWKCCRPTCPENSCDGSDGCGGKCGPSCDLGSYCAEGVCLSLCVDECDGLQCGKGRCGGRCSFGKVGNCADPAQVCIDGDCLNDCAGIAVGVGCCRSEVSHSCSCALVVGTGQYGCELLRRDCWSSSGPEQCGWQQDYAFWPDETAGDYRCGGVGSDPSGTHSRDCGAFQCRGPSCSGKECGPDGCGGYCGECPPGHVCVAGSCCEQSCSGRACGPDGCRGYCGECPLGHRCNETFQCEPCVAPCTHRECGPDGCGGYCGSCSKGSICAGGSCLSDCGGIGPEGCCDGDIVVWCVDDSLYRFKCGPGLNYCGWRPTGVYDCLTEGRAEPSGALPLSCSQYCHPSCTGTECGPDGCGGSCGQCTPDRYCDDSGLCLPIDIPEPHPDSAEPDIQTSDLAHDLSGPDGVDSDWMADPDGTGEITDGDDPKPRKKGGCGMASDGSVDLRGLALLLGMLLLLMGRRRRAL